MEGKRRWGEGNLVVRENADRLMRHVTAAVAGGFAASGKWHHGEARQGKARGAGAGGGGGGVACAISIFCGSEL